MCICFVHAIFDFGFNFLEIKVFVCILHHGMKKNFVKLIFLFLFESQTYANQVFNELSCCT